MNGFKALKTDDKPLSRWRRLNLWFYEWRISLPGHYWRHDLYWKLRSYVIPQHRALRKTVPRTWADLCGIIPDFLFECIIDFVEREKCFETIVWEEEDEKELRDLYDFAKWRRHEMAAAESQALHEWAQADGSTLFWRKNVAPMTETEIEEARRLFSAHTDLEAAREQAETDYMIRIIKFREKM